MIVIANAMAMLVQYLSARCSAPIRPSRRRWRRAAFAVALLASGLSSSSVGTYAGQVVMRGFIRRKMPVFLRRVLTMLPALVVLAL